MRNIIAYIAEQKIEEAIQEGQFDQLPGKGKPLNLDEDWAIPPEWRSAVRLLKNANVLPDWMESSKIIEQARTHCKNCWQRAENEYPRKKELPTDVFERWFEASLQAYEQAMRQVNDLILRFNYSAPLGARIEIPYPVKQEVERFRNRFAR